MERMERAPRTALDKINLTSLGLRSINHHLGSVHREALQETGAREGKRVQILKEMTSFRNKALGFQLLSGSR